VKVGDRWTFQTYSPVEGGSPAVKKVKRTAADGKEVDVYAPHIPKGANEKDWEEIKTPIALRGSEEMEATALTRFTAAIDAQAEQVLKGMYKTRAEALAVVRKLRP